MIAVPAPTLCRGHCRRGAPVRAVPSGYYVVGEIYCSAAAVKLLGRVRAPSGGWLCSTCAHEHIPGIVIDYHRLVAAAIARNQILTRACRDYVEAGRGSLARSRRRLAQWDSTRLAQFRA